MSREATRLAEQQAWDRYVESVRIDCGGRWRDKIVPASAETLRLGAIWKRAYRERELHRPGR